MKRVLGLFLLLCLYLVPSLEGLDILPDLQDYEIMAEGKAAYYYPCNHKFRKIYGGDGIYGGEVTLKSCSNYALFVSADYYSTRGHSIGLHDKTRVQLIPVGFGVKYFIPLNFMEQWCGGCVERSTFYVGAGANYLFMTNRDHSRHVIKHVRKSGLGYLVKAGLIIDLPCNWYLDVFGNYTDNTFSFHRTDGGRVSRTKAFVNGISGGVGIGYRFGADLFGGLVGGDRNECCNSNGSW